MESKSLFRSKTFWLNVAGAVITYANLLPVDAHTLSYIILGANVVVRLLTNSPVHVLPDGPQD